MASDDAVVFIDTQLYIDLYRTRLGKELLGVPAASAGKFTVSVLEPRRHASYL